MLFVFIILMLVQASSTPTKFDNSDLMEKEKRDNSLPAWYDIRDIDGLNYAASIKNQNVPNYCNASWAFAATSAVNDRLRLVNKLNLFLPDLSPQAIINCELSSYGCQGGSPLQAYHYMHKSGVPDDSCLPYGGFEEKCLDINICRSCSSVGVCKPIYNYHRYYVSDYGSISGESNMMKEIFNRGTISCRISISDRFRIYREGIIMKGYMGTISHYISIIGWGNEYSIPFWIARNSWGSSWGEAGFFRIHRGVNLMGVEDNCSWGIPADLPTKEIPVSDAEHNFESCGFPTDWSLHQQVILSPLPYTYINISSLPKLYDIRDLNGIAYVTPNKNQRSPDFCKSCWAQSAASSLSDRLLLSNHQKWPLIDISSQVFLNCADGSCNGGDAGEAYRYAYLHGVPDKTCQAEDGLKKNCDRMGICMDCRDNNVCWPVDIYRHIFVTEYGEVSGVDNMLAEIYARGPITCFMVMTEEFMNYRSGIFVEHDHNYKGGHIVEVTGWGTSPSGQRYWIVRNNWGEYWGENGWFYINMGGSNLLIENSCSWGVPVID